MLICTKAVKNQSSHPTPFKKIKLEKTYLN